MTDSDFTAPESLNQAYDDLARLQRDIDSINLQLNDPTLKSYRDGTPKPDDIYQAWRKSAEAAKLAKKAEVRYIRNWIEQNKPRAVGDRLLVTVVTGLMPIIQKADSANLLSPEEQAFVTQVAGMVTGAAIAQY